MAMTAAPGGGAGERVEVSIRKAIGPGDDKVHTWPHLVRPEFLCLVIVLIGMIIWSLTVDAPLEEPANPSRTPNPSKAPWYFLGLQEMLVFFDPWHAGVVLPSLIIVGLMVIPYIDINPAGNGYYCFEARKWEILTFFFGFHILWVSLIVIGTLLRGPGWNWFWPWEHWDPHRVEALTNVNLPYLLGIRDYFWSAIFGLVSIGLFFAVGAVAIYAWVVWLKGPDFITHWGWARFGLTTFLMLNMIATFVKMVMRHLFNIKYIMETPWINI